MPPRYSLTPSQLAALRSLEWLDSSDAGDRGTGRTTVLALHYLWKLIVEPAELEGVIGVGLRDWTTPLNGLSIEVLDFAAVPWSPTGPASTQGIFDVIDRMIDQMDLGSIVWINRSGRRLNLFGYVIVPRRVFEELTSFRVRPEEDLPLGSILPRPLSPRRRARAAESAARRYGIARASFATQLVQNQLAGLMDEYRRDLLDQLQATLPDMLSIENSLLGFIDPPGHTEPAIPQGWPTTQVEAAAELPREWPSDQYANMAEQISDMIDQEIIEQLHSVAAQKEKSNAAVEPATKNVWAHLNDDEEA